MKKVKKIWNENRVLMVLAIIIVICLIVIVCVSLTYFYGSSESEYGNRLEGIKEVKVTDKIKNDVISNLESEDSIDNANLVNKGRMIYITLNFKAGTTMENAKVVADKAVTLFSEEYLAFYDLNITISAPTSGDIKGYTLMGARNANGSGVIVWNNLTVKDETKE